MSIFHQQQILNISNIAIRRRIPSIFWGVNLINLVQSGFFANFNFNKFGVFVVFWCLSVFVLLLVWNLNQQFSRQIWFLIEHKKSFCCWFFDKGFWAEGFFSPKNTFFLKGERQNFYFCKKNENRFLVDFQIHFTLFRGVSSFFVYSFYVAFLFFTLLCCK